MAKKYLGVDIGYDTLKLAVCRGRKVKKTASVPMPANLLRDGRVTSVETMGGLLRETMKKYRIHAGNAALVLSGEAVYLRTAVMPLMNTEQLLYNIAYEFNDYITDDIKRYVFDYAMISEPGRKKKPEKKGQEAPAQEASAPAAPAASLSPFGMESEPAEDSGDTMELLAVAAPGEMIEDLREVSRKAGMKLKKAAPAESAYIALIRATAPRGAEEREYCILDLGYHAIRMYMFRGERHMVTRALEVGLSNLDSVIADEMGVDQHLAHTYLLNNFDDCQNQPYSVNAYNSIAIELQRAMNFYRFSNRDSQLADVWLTGGGAVIEPLRQAIVDALDMTVHDAAELVPGGAKVKDCHSFLLAIGAAMV